jgi:hypothetical protein
MHFLPHPHGKFSSDRGSYTVIASANRRPQRSLRRTPIRRRNAKDSLMLARFGGPRRAAVASQICRPRTDRIVPKVQPLESKRSVEPCLKQRGVQRSRAVRGRVRIQDRPWVLHATSPLEQRRCQITLNAGILRV